MPPNPIIVFYTLRIWGMKKSVKNMLVELGTSEAMEIFLDDELLGSSKVYLCKQKSGNDFPVSRSWHSPTIALDIDAARWFYGAIFCQARYRHHGFDI